MNETETKYRPFIEAREFVRKLKIKSEVVWHKYVNNANKDYYKIPSDIPPNPDLIYRNVGWKDFSDWLGIEYLDFNTARNIIRYFKIKSKKEWDDSYFTFMPVNLRIPFKPDEYYRNKGWISWEDWLSVNEENKSISQNITNNKSQNEKIEDVYEFGRDGNFLIYRSFNSAREYIKHLGLSSIFEWEQYVAGLLSTKGNKPPDIPDKPNEVYKTSGWRGWFYWLGYEMIPFDKARKFARSLNFKYKSEWMNYTLGMKNFHIPINYDIPDDPSVYYKNEGWDGWADWLGVAEGGNWRNFTEAREFARSLKLKGKEEWMDYVRNRSLITIPLPDDIPKDPSQRYKNKGWVSWTNWVRSDIKSNKNNVYIKKPDSREVKNFRPYSEAKEFVNQLELKNSAEWAAYCQGRFKESIPMPDDIPTNPKSTYAGKGWISWGDWLGKFYQGKPVIKYREYINARNFVWKLGLKNSQDWAWYIKGKYKNKDPLPKDIPRNPKTAYYHKGWKNWSDWLVEPYNKE